MRNSFKALAVVLVAVLAISVGGFIIYERNNSDENIILGKWEAKFTAYEFKENGVVIIGTTIDVSSKGEYSMNAKEKTIEITYSAFDFSYTHTYKYIFGEDENTLTLTDASTDKISVAYKRITE